MKVILLLFLVVLVPTHIHAQTKGEKARDTIGSYYRYYEVGIAPNYDLNSVARNGLTTFKLSQDAFTYGIRPHMSPKAGKIAAGFWSFSTTFLSMIWSHEFGHSMRAKQVGGQFKIHNFAIPFPYTTMHLPPNVTYQQTALSVTGGFEINYMTSKLIQDDFYEYNGLHNDQLALGFAHRLMYPIYVSLVIPQNPKKKETWINTGGDPVHFIKPVWQHYSNDQVFNTDSTINKGLVNFYYQSAIFATVWNLADPMFYKEIAAMGGDVIDGKKPWYLVGDENYGWTYGTMFNTSPLGYELFLNNYIQLDNHLFALRLKFGRPFKNYSIALESPNILRKKRLKWGGYVEYWNQDIYGHGLMAASNLNFLFNKRVGVKIQMGYKTDGYTIGRSLDDGLFGWFGLNYILN